jgi:2-amino-4-hydroxy-6-hydroxymethyldihydropteridine diphosphokinase
LKKILNKNLTLYFDKNYPYKTKKKSDKRHIATLGIGGNIGNTRQRFQKLFIFLQRSKAVTVIQTSPILQNPAFGYTEQKDFYNAVIVVKTDLNPIRLLKFVLRVEKFFKRVRHFENSPRTLDIDILFYDRIFIHGRDLTIPHPHYQNRESVLIPLAYIV